MFHAAKPRARWRDYSHFLQSVTQAGATKTFHQRHGGPWDRGAADAWYSRPKTPHYYRGGSYTSIRVSEHGMTPPQVEAYEAGYNANYGLGGKEYD